MHIKKLHSSSDSLGQNSLKTPSKIHQCIDCTKIFQTPSKLLRHKKSVHEGQKPFECDICSKNFSATEHLKIHIKTVHDGEKNYVCSICHKKYGHASSLNEHHKIIHEGEKKYRSNNFICQICNLSYQTHTNLKIHINRVHEKIKNFKCHLCPMKFSQNWVRYFFFRKRDMINFRTMYIPLKFLILILKLPILILGPQKAHSVWNSQ